MLMICACYLDATPANIQVTVALIFTIRNFLASKSSQSSSSPRFTLRNICRFLDTAYNLANLHRELKSFSSILLAAYEATVQSQFISDYSALDKDIMRILFPNVVDKPYRIVYSQLQAHEGGQDHVFSDSRKKHAGSIKNHCLLLKILGAVLGCIESNIACLLEGPPAVGKTSLIYALASSSKKTVERVNNTDTTTIQDYLGSFLPCGKEFKFQDGALVRALKKGHW